MDNTKEVLTREELELIDRLIAPAVLSSSEIPSIYRVLLNLTKSMGGQAEYWAKWQAQAKVYGEVDIVESQRLRKARRFKNKECFYNATMLALDYPERFKYVEGFATSIIPCDHAWVVDKKTGLVIDPTWNDPKKDLKYPGRDYYGIEIPREFVVREVLKTECAQSIAWKFILGED